MVPWLLAGAMLLFAVICVGVSGIALLLGKSSSTEDESILAVLEKDEALGAHVVAEDRDGLIHSLTVYTNAASRIDLTGCPPDFRVAYRRHIHAWEKVAIAAAELPKGVLDAFLMGAINSVLRGESDGGLGRIESTLNQALKDVETSWYQVEDVALGHGVAL